MLINCPNCGQKNRINQKRDDSQAICAKCWTRLNIPEKSIQPPPPAEEPYTPSHSQKGATKSRRGSFRWILWIVIGVGIYWFLSQTVPDTTSNTAAKNDSDLKPTTSHPKTAKPVSDAIQTKNRPAPKPTPNYPEVAMPLNGAIQTHTKRERVAPLEIQTSDGSNYLVKLVSVDLQQPVMTIFVRGGNSVSTQVPLGTYEIKYASGKKWYGYKHIFGPDTSYNKADEIFNFFSTRTTVKGYTITLYPVPGGNLRTIGINPSQF